MDKEYIRFIISELRCLVLFPRRYRTPKGKTKEYWGEVFRRYKNEERVVESSDYHWRMIEYTDGHRELAYIRVLQGGFFSGRYSALYRGLVFPRRIGYGTFSHIKDIRLAF